MGELKRDVVVIGGGGVCRFATSRQGRCRIAATRNNSECAEPLC